MGCQRPSRFWGLGCPKIYHEAEDTLVIGYLADGRLNISNALAENAIRPFAVGRRNWLFADTPRGAKASATTYSLIETAKAKTVCLPPPCAAAHWWGQYS